MPRTLSIVGAGRVGRALGRRLHELGWKIGAVVTRNQPSARKAVRIIGAGHGHASLTRRVLEAEIIFVTTPDSAVSQVASELARIGAEELRDTIVLHTSGALSSDALAPVRPHGAAIGSMHPLQSFSGVGVPPLEGRVFAIEGDPAAVRAARQIARTLGAIPARLERAKKPLYHAAGAMAASSVLALLEAAVRLMTASGMKRREAIRALLPLTRQVLENFERLGPRAAWTGPLSRGDFEVVAAHCKALEEFPEQYREAYQAVNRLAAAVLAADPEAMFAELGRAGARTSKVKATGGLG